MTSPNIARILIDEDLSPRLIGLLQGLRYDVDKVPRGAKDVDIIRALGASHGSKGVWITADRAAMIQHRRHILSSGISIALVNAHNALSETQCFMIFSFIYRRSRLTADADAPMYFKLAPRLSALGPNIAIRQFSL